MHTGINFAVRCLLSISFLIPLTSAAATLEEVVVTAQKREQSLQDVSTAVTAVSSQRLESAKINNLEDLQFIVPSITLGNDFNMAKVFIRGVGANTSTTGSETGVAMHVDGVFIGRAEAQMTSLFDLERIEVLRGPQGSLYGRNAVGGSINLVTAKPTEEPQGYGRVTLGNYDTLDVEGAVSGAITDRILGRVAFKSEDRGGFGKNPVTGNDVDDLNRKMARAHLEFIPNDDLDILLTGEWYHQDDASRALKFQAEAFPTVPRLRSGGSQPSGIPSYATDPRDLASEVDPATYTDTWSISSHIDWRMNDEVTISNITNYRYFWTFITQDLDLAAVQNSDATTGFNTTVQRRDVESRQYSTEFQFKYDSDWTNSVLGLFYFNERQRPVDTVGLAANRGQDHILANLANPNNPTGPFTTGLNIDGANITPRPIDPAFGNVLCNTAEHDGDGFGQTVPPKRVCIKSDLGTEVWAIFGQANIHLGAFSDALENFTIKLGGRYSEEERTATNASQIIAGNGLGAVLITTADGTFNKETFKDFTPEVGLEWRATPNMLAYYTYSEGFKAGAGENAASPSPVAPFTSVIVDPEEIQNHEFGIKSTWFDNRLSVNVSGYFYDLQGQQINKTLAGGPAGFGTIFENAAETSAHGVELEFSATPTDEFRMDGSISYLKSEYDDFLTIDPLDPRNVSTGPVADGNPATDFAPQPEVQLAGNATRNSPEWTANLHAEYDIMGLGLPYGGWLTLMGDFIYRDDTYFTEFNRAVEGEDSYVMLDLNLRYTSGNEKFFADLWVKNATDEFIKSSTFQLATARVIGVTHMPPRTYGITMGYNF